jgi:hypothetical protein
MAHRSFVFGYEHGVKQSVWSVEISKLISTLAKFCANNISVRKLDHFDYLDVNGGIILKWML